MFQGHSVL